MPKTDRPVKRRSKYKRTLIYDTRVKLGLLQKQVAIDSGIHAKHYQKIETGVTKATVFTAYKISKVLKINLLNPNKPFEELDNELMAYLNKKTVKL